VLLLVGIAAVVSPQMTIAVLVKVLGLYLVIEGILSLLAAGRSSGRTRSWMMGRGIVALLAGLVVFVFPAMVAALTAATILYLIGGFLVFAGILEIGAAWEVRMRSAREPVSMIAGIGAVLFGLLLFVAPVGFGMTLVQMLGVFAIINGLSLVGLAGRIKTMAS